MFCSGFLLSAAGNIIHLFTLSMPTGLGVRGLAHQTTYHSFRQGQEAKISNILKNKS